MIVGDLKTLGEIEGLITGKERVLVLGCRGCVTVCSVGGEKEVALLASELRISDKVQGRQRQILEATIERQCDREYIEPILKKIGEAEIVLSMACGAGVQFVSDLALPLPVVPAVNTTLIGVAEQQGIWGERCQSCGNCILDQTGGICPIARCSKSLLNGPCGGSSGGKCEISRDVDCAWQLIYDRLLALGQLEKMRRVLPAREWSTSRDGGPRKRIREDLRK